MCCHGYIVSFQCIFMYSFIFFPLASLTWASYQIRRECRERFPRHRLQRKPLVSDPGIHRGTCVTHVEIAKPQWRENFPDISGPCATRNFTYLAKGPLDRPFDDHSVSEVNLKDIAVKYNASVMTSPESWPTPLIPHTLLIQICGFLSDVLVDNGIMWYIHWNPSRPFYWHTLILIPTWIITCPVKCGMKLLIHSQTSTINKSCPRVTSMATVRLSQCQWSNHKGSLPWRHYKRHGVSNHRHFEYLFNRLFRCRSKKTLKLRVTGRCKGTHRRPVDSPHKVPVTRKFVSIWWRHYESQPDNKAQHKEWYARYQIIDTHNYFLWYIHPYVGNLKV